MAASYGFQQEWLPGNPLNASLQGYSTFLTGNMPAQFAVDSIGYAGINPSVIGYLNNTQNPNRSLADWERVIRQNQQQTEAQSSPQESEQKSGLQQMFDYWKYRAQGYSQEEAEKLAGIYQGNQAVQEYQEQIAQLENGAEFCARFGTSGIARSICDTSVDAGKRIGVATLGVLLIALGVWSLR